MSARSHNIPQGGDPAAEIAESGDTPEVAAVPTDAIRYSLEEPSLSEKLQINPRPKLSHAKKIQKPRVSKQLVFCPVQKKVPLPWPKSPLSIIWSPDRLYFELQEKPVIQKLRIMNACSRLIYIHCCGLWNESARLGAGWRTYPRTRFLLAPGMSTELWIRATPRTHSPISATLLCLQLAASHKLDTVTAYFAVPVVAKFLRYLPPSIGEGG